MAVSTIELGKGHESLTTKAKHFLDRHKGLLITTASILVGVSLADLFSHGLLFADVAQIAKHAGSDVNDVTGQLAKGVSKTWENVEQHAGKDIHTLGREIGNDASKVSSEIATTAKNIPGEVGNFFHNIPATIAGFEDGAEKALKNFFYPHSK